MGDVNEKLEQILPAYKDYIGSGDERKLQWIKEQMVLHLRQYPKVLMKMTLEEYVKQMMDYYAFGAALAIK